MARGGAIEYAPVGATLQNGFDLGGARIYPFSTGLAITPPAYYSDYIGSASGLPVAPPVAAQAGSTGVGSNNMIGQATSKPFGSNSPLPWVIVGLFGAVAATHIIHYSERKR